MRLASLLLLLVLSVGWFACRLEVTPQPPLPEASAESRWVRTVHGWERPIHWRPLPGPYEPPLHPLVVATVEWLLATIALLGLPEHAAATAARGRPDR